jgi:hypothetical protein
MPLEKQNDKKNPARYSKNTVMKKSFHAVPIPVFRQGALVQFINMSMTVKPCLIMRPACGCRYIMK